MTRVVFPAEIAATSRLLAAAEFPAWQTCRRRSSGLANLSNPSARRAYENAILDFIGSPVSPGRRNSAP